MSLVPIMSLTIILNAILITSMLSPSVNAQSTNYIGNIKYCDNITK